MTAGSRCHTTQDGCNSEIRLRGATLSQAIELAEHAMNHLRLTYLMAIKVSEFHRSSPAEAVNQLFNGAFLVMSGFGDVFSTQMDPSEYSDYLEGTGFEPEACLGLDWNHGITQLEQALNEIRHAPGPSGLMLAELYSFHPGFHEPWLHDRYPQDYIEDLDQVIGRIQEVNRGLQKDHLNPSHEAFERLTDLRFFITYAACDITEGPLVRRRHRSISYLEALRAIGPEPTLEARQQRLQESFEVLDTWQYLQDHNSEEGLHALIEAASAFLESSPVRSLN